MKLTKTIQEAFINDVLAGEVKSQDFAGRIDVLWRDMISSILPVGVAALYGNDNTRGWVNPQRIEETRLYIINTYKNDPGAPARFKEGFESIDRIEVERAAHYRNIDNIRDAITKVCDSVTTVMGVAKLLPKYKKYLPSDATRPTKTEAAVAAVTAETAVVKANIPAPKPRAKRPASRRSSGEAAPRTRSSGSRRTRTVQARFPFLKG